MAVFLTLQIQVQGKPQGKGHHLFPWNSSSGPRIEVHVVFPHCCWFKKKIIVLEPNVAGVHCYYDEKTVIHKIAGKRIATKDMIFFSTPIWNQPMRFLNEQTSVGGLNHIGWREVVGGKVVMGMLQLLGRRTGIYTSGQIITTNDLSRGHLKYWFRKGIPPKSP